MNVEDDDESLLAAFRGGTAAACSTLYSRHERPVYRYLLRSLSDKAAAEDVMQDTWMTVMRSAADFKPDHRFTAWLYTIARSRLVDHLRRHRPMVSLDAEAANDPDSSETLLDRLVDEATPSPEHLSIDRERARALMDRFERLPAPQRDVFLLHVQAGLEIDEIAALVGAGAEAVRSRLRYAVARLTPRLSREANA
ncbi:RNA polymerase sigma factor [soil metagenome]